MRNGTFWLTVAIVAAVSSLAGQVAPKPDPFQPLERFIGQWQGTAEGEPGKGSVERTYEFVLRNHYIRVSNKSVYPPQEKNKTGETHEDVGYFSFDKGRKLLVLRQFHVEGFVNTYLQEPASDGKLVFLSEAIENISPGWRARESFTFTSNDEFTERFELAEPGKGFETYTESHFRRVRK